MIQKKKEINKNWLYSIIIVLLFLFGVFTGFRNNMLDVKAVAFPNSSVTYNEGQTLKSSYTNAMNFTYDSVVHINYFYGFNGSANKYQVVRIDYPFDTTTIQAVNTYIYNNCSYNNGTLTCTNSYTGIAANTTSSIASSNTSVNISINSNNVVIDSHTYTIVTAGYSQAEYEAYGQQQYNAGYSAGVAYVQAHPAEYSLYTSQQYSANYTAGQNSVINSPHTYGLYTQAQYEANYTSGYSAGVAYVQAHPSDYNLYTASQYNSYGSSQFTAGESAVTSNPNDYNLYTASQYNSYGNSQFTAGESAVTSNPNDYNLYTSQQYADNYTAGQNSVINDPNTYGLYTLAQYNAHAQEQYDSGYLAGQQASTNYQDGIQYVIDHPAEYNLYTTAQYNDYGTAQYTAGQNSVINDPNTYGLYNQVQMETAEQNSYSDGYQAGIDSYSSNNVIIPTFTINKDSMYYACLNNNNYHDACGANTPNTDTEVSTLKPSNYMPYTDTDTYLISSIVSNSGTFNIDSFSYYIGLKVTISANGTIAIPDSVTNMYVKFCHSEGEYYMLGERYTYCKSIASNVNDTGNGQYYGVNDVYDNYGIYIGDIDTIENNYRLINLNDYLVGSLSNYSWLEITLVNTASDIQTQYSNLTFTYTSGTLDSEAYNLGYQNGFSKGNQIGLATGKQENYNNGYNAGYQQARRVGDNSIRGLAETILTSPVNMFKSIFNVEFLGVNLAGFILSIITMLVVIWLIKKLW